MKQLPASSTPPLTYRLTYFKQTAVSATSRFAVAFDRSSARMEGRSSGLIHEILKSTALNHPFLNIFKQADVTSDPTND
jgi:hypothetical protein